MKVKFYLTRPQSTTSTGIFARLSYEGRRLKYYLSETILPIDWDTQTQTAIGKTKSVKDFNDRLIEFKTLVTKYHRVYKDANNTHPSTDTLKQIIDANYKQIEAEKPIIDDMKETFFGYFDDLLDRTEKGLRLTKKDKPYSKDTIKAYRTTYKLLKELERTKGNKVDFESMGMTFYDALRKYTTSDLNMSTNTIGKHIKIVKTVLNEATEYGYNKNRDFQSKRFKVLREEVDSIYLNDGEIELLAKLNLSKNKRLETVRDLFLVGCFTGQSFADYSHMTKSSYDGKFIKYRRKKGSDEIVLAIKPQLKKILEKYDYNLPKSLTNQKTNEYLKEIGAMLPILNINVSHTYTKGGKTVTMDKPKYQLISTHTGRRSFASNEYLNGTPVLSIMQLTGHKTESSFMKYIRLSSEDHAKVIQNTWDKRERKLRRA